MTDLKAPTEAEISGLDKEVIAAMNVLENRARRCVAHDEDRLLTIIVRLDFALSAMREERDKALERVNQLEEEVMLLKGRLFAGGDYNAYKDEVETLRERVKQLEAIAEAAQKFMNDPGSRTWTGDACDYGEELARVIAEAHGLDWDRDSFVQARIGNIAQAILAKYRVTKR